MGLKADIIKTIEQIPNFGFSTNISKQKDFKKKAKLFLNSRTYGDLEINADDLIQLIFSFHDKASSVPPALNCLREYEIKEIYENFDRHYIMGSCNIRNINIRNS